MATWIKQTKNDVVWNTPTATGKTWNFGERDLTFGMSRLNFGYWGEVATWSKQNKNNSSWSNQTKQ